MIIRSYPSAARSIGNVSIIARTPVAAANLSVSSESFEVPDGHPIIDLWAPRSETVDISDGSKLAPTTTSLPFTAKPSTSGPNALPSGAVARITLAPPSLFSSAATSCLPESM